MKIEDVLQALNELKTGKVPARLQVSLIDSSWGAGI